jgi:putative Mg2+ transporter-C (MgtC) family protein
MRNPLGILTGIGFLGAGAILRKDGLVHGLTSAATIWFTTVLGLLFGGGQLILACIATVIVLIILWGLKHVENRLPKQRRGVLHITFAKPAAGKLTLDEDTLRARLNASGYIISTWTPHYCAASLHSLQCEVQWPSRGKAAPETPALIREFAAAPETASLFWRS